MCEQSIVIHVISDSSGETATEFVRAAAIQFGRGSVLMSRLARLEELGQLRSYLDRYVDDTQPTAVFHTLLDDTLREQVRQELDARGLSSVDLLGPTLRMFRALVGEAPLNIPRSQAEVDGGILRSIDARAL